MMDQKTKKLRINFECTKRPDLILTTPWQIDPFISMPLTNPGREIKWFSKDTLLAKAYLRLGPSPSNPQVYAQKIQVK